MTRLIAVLAAALLWTPTAGLAADCAPLDLATQACQDAIGKAGATYQKKHMAAVNACLGKYQKGKLTGPDPVALCRGTSLASLPTDPTTAAKITGAITAVSAMYALKCTDPQVASLGLCASTVAGLQGCLFDEHYASVDAALDEESGTVAPSADPLLQKCQTTIGKESAKFLNGRMKAIQKCFKDRNKVCGTSDPLPRCVALPTVSPTAVVNTLPYPKAEAKAALTVAKAKAKMDAKVALACSDAQVAALDACGDTKTALSACITCTHGNSADDQVANDYRAVRVATTSTGLQPVADAADDGDTILVQPGTYSETMELKSDGLTVLGHKSCTTGNRPLIVNPGSAPIGISSCGSRLGLGCTNTADDQLLQSLEVNNFGDYDVYTTGADGVTYRDLVTRGPETVNVTRYGPFPILSNNVLIEDCFVEGISDAGIYVGQSTNIVVRNNEVQTSVAGIEIENSANAEVYGNFAHDNTAGILIFKLPGLPVQLSNCHNVHDNVASNNNHSNYGLGYLQLVPVGTGMLFLSNDTGWFHNNTISGNNTLGFAATDQGVLNALNDPDPFSPPSPDIIPVNNYIVNNTFNGNGSSPDPAFVGFQSDTLAVFSVGAAGNCQNGNTGVVTDIGMGGLPACPGGGVAQPPGCPYIPPTTTSTTTSTSTTAIVTTTSTTLMPTFTNVYNTIFTPRCSGCHGTGTLYYFEVGTQSATYANIVNVASHEVPSMDRIEPGDPTLSYLQHKVDGTQGTVGGSGTAQMPLGGPYLSTTERDLIRNWILGGALNN